MNTSHKVKCPVCGSNDIQSEHVEEHSSLPFGQMVVFEKIIHTCNACGEVGEFTEEGDENYLKALEIAKKDSLAVILNDLSKSGLSYAYIERALQLSQRTLSRWKSKGISASGMALMKIVGTFPWVLKVADENYDKTYANQVLVSQAAIVLENVIKENEVSTPVIHFSSFEEGPETFNDSSPINNPQLVVNG